MPPLRETLLNKEKEKKFTYRPVSSTPVKMNHFFTYISRHSLLTSVCSRSRALDRARSAEINSVLFFAEEGGRALRNEMKAGVHVVMKALITEPQDGRRGQLLVSSHFIFLLYCSLELTIKHYLSFDAPALIYTFCLNLKDGTLSLGSQESVNKCANLPFCL